MTGTPSPLPDPLDGRAFSISEGQAAGLSPSRLRAKDLSAPHAGVRSPSPGTGALGVASDYLPKMAEHEFFTHTTSALMHGFWLDDAFEQEELAHVAVHEPRRAPRDERVRGHHLIDRTDLVTEKDGVRLSGEFETWCQLAGMLTREDLVAAGDWLLRKGVEHPEARREKLIELAADPHRPFHKRLANAAMLTRCGVRSRPESHLRLLLQDAGMPEPDINVDLFDENGRWLAQPDLVHRGWKVLVEYEGDGHRVDKEQFRKDVDRYELLQAHGWIVIRVHADELYNRPDQLVARVLRAIRSRSAR